MTKIIFFITILFNLLTLNSLASTLTIVSPENKNEFKKAYFAGGCFWCMEESFDSVRGVIESISGYSGGHVKNPTYNQVIYKDTGHVEAIEVSYDPKLVSYEELLKVFMMQTVSFVTKVKAIGLLRSTRI